MTKNEYLIELAIKIQALTDKPGQIHDELKAMLTFYQEMIEDKMEDGMTEEEAVAAMETPDEIAGRLMRELEDEKITAPAADTDDAEKVYAKACDESTLMRREYDADALNRIIIEDENSGIQIKRGDVVAVNSYDNAEGFYEVVCNAGVLMVKYKRSIRNFFRLPMFRKKRGELVLEVPLGWDGELVAITSNAKIEMDAAIRDIMLRTSNAGIVIIAASADRVRAVTSNGSINAEHVNCRAAEFITSNSKVDVQDVTAAETLRLATSNGKIVAGNSSATVFSAQTSNGGISIQGVIADDITLKSSNGSISGTLPGSIADYAITSKTSNGKNSLPDGTKGAKKLDVRTSNAKIDITFSE